MQCTALIVDDEPLARVRMRSLLAPYSSEIEIVGEASSGADAIEKIGQLLPDVVFLDIQLDDMDAFDHLEIIQKRIPDTKVDGIVCNNFYNADLPDHIWQGHKCRRQTLNRLSYRLTILSNRYRNPVPLHRHI